MICDILYKRDETSTEYRAFLDENQYYKDRLKGKPVNVNQNYRNISTEKEYIQWLAEYHEKIKVRNTHKRGTSNETYKRHGNEHKGKR